MSDGIKIETLDRFLEVTQPYGSQSKSLTNVLKGLNYQPGKTYLPNNKDHQGYTFFTRPQLNLTSRNLRNVRKLYGFLTANSLSPYRYARCMLDPRLQEDGDPDGMIRLEVDCGLVDRLNPFIPCLTNCMKSISGWPDIAMPNFTSKAGIRQEEWSITDGPFDIFNAYDIDVTFYNIRNEPIILLFYLWEYYQSLVFEGMFSPYADFIANNEIDYNTRIYRLVMDETKTFVKKIAATGASFPVTLPTGQFFDYDESKVYADQTKEFTIKFRCMGADYNDHISLQEFNAVTCIFNKDMLKLQDGNKPSNFEKIPKALLNHFNYRAYPWINLDTTELEWYVNKDDPMYKTLSSFDISQSKQLTENTNTNNGGFTEALRDDFASALRQ